MLSDLTQIYEQRISGSLPLAPNQSREMLDEMYSRPCIRDGKDYISADSDDLSEITSPSIRLSI